MSQATDLPQTTLDAPRRPPSSCCRWSTTSCASSPPRSWPHGEARPDAPGHRPGPRGLPAAGRAGGSPQRWDGRGHFFAAAAEAMRRILVEQRPPQADARSAAAAGRGVDLDDVDDRRPGARRRTCSPLDEALDRLAADDPTAAELVKLRFFAGLSLDEAAEALGISPRTADRHWAYARAWLPTERDPTGRTHERETVKARYRTSAIAESALASRRAGRLPVAASDRRPVRRPAMPSTASVAALQRAARRPAAGRRDPTGSEVDPGPDATLARGSATDRRGAGDRPPRSARPLAEVGVPDAGRDRPVSFDCPTIPAPVEVFPYPSTWPDTRPLVGFRPQHPTAARGAANERARPSSGRRCWTSPTRPPGGATSDRACPGPTPALRGRVEELLRRPRPVR